MTLRYRSRISSFVISCSSRYASTASRTFVLRSRRSVSLIVFLTSCWVIVEPPCSISPASRFSTSARRRAVPVDAVVLVEAPVLDGEHRVDEVRGHVGEDDRLAVLLGEQRGHQAAVAVEHVRPLGRAVHRREQRVDLDRSENTAPAGMKSARQPARAAPPTATIRTNATKNRASFTSVTSVADRATRIQGSANTTGAKAWASPARPQPVPGRRRSPDRGRHRR